LLLMRLSLGIVFIFIFIMGCSPHSTKQIPLRDFFKNPEKTAFLISPDGRHISFLKPYKQRLNIFVQAVGAKTAKRITSVTDRDISSYIWKGNDHLVYSKDFSGDENYHLFLVDRLGREIKDLTPFAKLKAALIDDLPDNDQELIIQHNHRNPELFDAYRLNINSGKTKMIGKNPGNVIGWSTDHAGQLRLALTSEGLKHRILYRENESQPFKPILEFDFRDSFFPLFFDFENKQFFALSNLGRDKQAIIKFNLETGKETEILYQHPEVDMSGLYYSRKRKVLTAASYLTWKRKRVFFDQRTKEIFANLSKKLPKYEIVISDQNKNEDLLIVRTFTDRSLGAYYFYDSNKNTLTKLADVSPWLKEKNLAYMKPISYKSRDGLKIHGYLTLPKGKEPKNLPVVVIPHGGPHVRESWGYSPAVQFLANRGYAVLQMNFRGSTGYGKKFEKMGYKQWGRKMQDDVTDGAKWLIKEGIADEKRIAIYGASYGGYVVLAGLTFTPDLYACGIDYVGISNLFTLLKSIPPYWKPMQAMMYERIGHPVKDKELLRKISPLFHAQRIKAPLMVIQGAKDPRVNINESNQIVAALKERGIDVPYIVKKNEGHGFRNEENRFEVYEAIEKFLAKHLKKRSN
jgi:dipeptidyl aminopeptidase/acylaminoacyl peptidase